MRKPRKPIEPTLPVKYERPIPSKFVTRDRHIYSLLSGITTLDVFKKEIEELYVRVEQLDNDPKFIKGSVAVDICSSYDDPPSVDVTAQFETELENKDYKRLHDMYVIQSRADEKRYKGQLARYNKSKQTYEESMKKYEEDMKLYRVYEKEKQEKEKEKEKQAELAMLRKLKAKYES